MDTALPPQRPFAIDGAAYPFASRWFDSGEGRMHYLDEGRGPVLLFVHGTPTWSYLYRHLIRRLRAQYRCIAVDHLGYGLSDKPADAAYAPADHARRLAALVDHLGVEDFVPVVHDFGGPIGLAVALRSPGRVRGVIAFNTWLWPLSGDPQARRLGRLLASPLGALLYRRFNASPRWLVPLAFADRSRLTAATHAAYLRPFARRAEREAPLAAGRALLSDWYAGPAAQLPALRGVAALLLWGLRDPAFGPEALARWKALWPGARVRAFADVGHFPQEEAPEAVADEVAAFLAGLAHDVPVEASA